MYKIINAAIVQRIADGACIPREPGNKDYQAFLLWEGQGNTAAPADVVSPASLLTAERAAALEQLTTVPNGSAKAVRALILLILDEINLLRKRDVDRAADVAAATTLADLKTRWAARSPALSDRTIAQLRTAMTTKLNAGDAD